MSSLAALLRHHRQRAGLTQKQLAEKISYHHSVISRTERSGYHYLPSEAYLKIFCRALALTDEEIAQIRAAYDHTIQIAENDLAQTSPERILPRWWSKKSALVGSALALTLLGMYLVASLTHTHPLRAASSWLKYHLSAPGDVLYQSDFSPPERPGWVDLNNGSWGIYYLNDNPTLGVALQNKSEVPNTYLTHSDEWSNYSVRLKAYFESGIFEQIYLVLRSAEKPNCSGYRVGGNRLGVEIFRFDHEPGNCRGERLAFSANTQLLTGKTYDLRVDVRGNKIDFYINSALALSAVDDKYKKGGFSLLAYEVFIASFDDILVTKLGE